MKPEAYARESERTFTVVSNETLATDSGANRFVSSSSPREITGINIIDPPKGTPRGLRSKAEASARLVLRNKPSGPCSLDRFARGETVIA